ncbi:thioredoxin family protein [Fulvivirga sp. 29W222]|uniref:Thioredoxin family protein n=1 Tax=Fulvivirga marina TaxID=2494733 RepID=A0A937G0I5_9BACT|nr:thioredoxin family protein [Fulvivirga marina]MBL6447750.1 thioredoxin family protein [Fulvivirga marina]
MRKILIVTTIILFAVISANAQEWQTDFEGAKAAAEKEDRNIVLVFQGSDWCAPCIKLDKEVWSTEEFQAYAKDHYVMLQADFPRKKQNALPEEQQQHNRKLAEKYNKNGYFPFVVVLDENGAVLGETGYKKMTPKEYISLLDSFAK